MIPAKIKIFLVRHNGSVYGRFSDLEEATMHSNVTVFTVVLCGLLLGSTHYTSASDLQIIDAPANQQVDVFSEVNTAGTVFVKIVSQTGTPCADFWWIEWPFGAVQQVGRHCNFARFDIPSTFKGSLAAKLRAGGFSNNLKIGLSTDEHVANSATFKF